MALHELTARPETVHWGYFDNTLAPAITVASGDLVRVEAITHHAGDAPDLLMDDGVRAIYDTVTDRGPGPHLLTGPVRYPETPSWCGSSALSRGYPTAPTSPGIGVSCTATSARSG
jgi:hypothetical protein